MLGRIDTNTHSKILTIFIAMAALLAALLNAACKNDSVVSNNGAQTAQANTAASPAAGVPANSQPGATLDAGATPATVPTTPIGPVGPSAPTSQSEEKRTVGNIPMTVTKAKPMLTPDPDPFPPRPTPTVVVKNGKVVQQWQAPADVANLVNPAKSNPDAVKMGRELYMQKCVDCHGKKGEGNGWMSGNTKRDGKPLPPTNLASQMTQANTDGELFWKITNGRSPMPAHRVRFDDEQRWQIVTYLRTLKK
ncbi:MAG: cytochrome c [Blastocatellales bacterium]